MIGVILGGHGITAWGATSDECEANSLRIIRSCQGVHRYPRCGLSPSAGPPRAGFEPLARR